MYSRAECLDGRRGDADVRGVDERERVLLLADDGHPPVEPGCSGTITKFHVVARGLPRTNDAQRRVRSASREDTQCVDHSVLTLTRLHATDHGDLESR
jgi:hypothetical protein